MCVCVRAHAILSTAKQRLETVFELDNDQWPHPLTFCVIFFRVKGVNPLNSELNPTCHLLALLEAHHILHVSRIRVTPICLGCYEKFYVSHSIHIHLLQVFLEISSFHVYMSQTAMPVLK